MYKSCSCCLPLAFQFYLGSWLVAHDDTTVVARRVVPQSSHDSVLFWAIVDLRPDDFLLPPCFFSFFLLLDFVFHFQQTNLCLDPQFSLTFVVLCFTFQFMSSSWGCSGAMPSFKVVPPFMRFTVYHRNIFKRRNFNKREQSKRFRVLLRHAFGMNKYWSNHFLYDPEQYPASYGVAKSLHAANARLVSGLPQRFLDTCKLFPVEEVEDDIRHSLWQAASQVDTPLRMEEMSRQQLFMQFLFPCVFQHLWRLPHTEFSKTNHMTYLPRLETFFSRNGLNSQIRTSSGMLLRNSIPVKPYAMGEEISSVLSGALKPVHDFSPRGLMQDMPLRRHESLVPSGGFLHGFGKKRTTPCDRRYAISHFMHDTPSEMSCPDRSLSSAILYMFGQLHGQAQVRDKVNITFRKYAVPPASGPHARGHQLAIPEVCHGVITDGRHYTFLIFQLHNLAPEFEGYENIVWTSEPMQLFDDLSPERAGPELNLECLRMLACLLNYDPRIHWPAYADEFQLRGD